MSSPSALEISCLLDMFSLRLYSIALRFSDIARALAEVPKYEAFEALAETRFRAVSSQKATPVLNSAEAVLLEHALPFLSKEVPSRDASLRLHSDIGHVLGRVRLAVANESSEDVRLFEEQVNEQLMWIEDVLKLLARPGTDSCNLQLWLYCLELCQAPIVPLISLVASWCKQLNAAESSKPEPNATQSSVIRDQVARLKRSFEAPMTIIKSLTTKLLVCPPRENAHMLLPCWRNRYLHMADRLQRLKREIESSQFEVDLETENMSSQFHSLTNDVVAEDVCRNVCYLTTTLEALQFDVNEVTQTEELAELLPSIPVDKLVEATDRLAAFLTESVGDQKGMAASITQTANDIAALFPKLGTAYRERLALGVGDEDARRFHEIACRTEYSKCPLRSVGHYLVPAVKIHIDDIYYIISHIEDVLVASGHEKEGVLKKQTPLILKALQHFHVHLQLQIRFLTEAKPSQEIRGEMEFEDTIVAEQFFELATNRLIFDIVQIHNRLPERCDEALSLQIMIKDIYKFVVDIVNRIPKAPYSCCRYLVGDRLRTMARSFDFASEKIRHAADDLKSVGSAWRRVLRKFCAMPTLLTLAFVGNAAGQVTDEQRRVLFLIEDVNATSIEQLRDCANKLNAEIEQMRGLIKDLHPLLDALPKSSILPDDCIASLDGIRGELAKLQRESIYTGVDSLLAFWPVVIATFASVKKLLTGLPVLVRRNAHLDLCPTLLRVEEIRLKEVLLHFADIRLERGSFEEIWHNPEIGRGSFGQVFKMTNGQKLALKRINVDCTSEERFGAVMREIRALEKLQHDFVIPYMGLFIADHVCNEEADSAKATNVNEECLSSANGSITLTSHCAYRIVELGFPFYDKGTLRDWLNRNNNNEDIEMSKIWLAQLADGLNYIHGQGLIHRDIKPDNVFIGEDDQMIIGDFGLVWMAKTPEVSSEITDQPDTNRTANRGTFKYMAPEVMNNSGPTDQTESSQSDQVAEYGNKADIYSLGQVYFDMLESYPSFRRFVNFPPTTCDSKEKMEQRARIEKDAEVASWLTERDPADRPSCAELLQSDYLKDVDYKNRKSVKEKSDMPGPSSTITNILINEMTDFKITKGS